MSSPKPYSSKTAIIIGGTHGIGLTTAQLLLSLGATVLLTGTSSHKITAAKETLSSYGNSATVVNSDITSSASLASLTTLIETEFPQKIDLLFINAGYCKLESFLSVTEESFDRTMAVNFKGAFFTVQKLVPLINPGGSIVFTTSVANVMGFPDMSVYGPTKAAIKNLVEHLGAELVGRGIRVNAVSPGFIKTETMGVSGVGEKDLEMFEGIGAKVTPMGRIGTTDEVAKAVVWVGLEATFSTGTEVVVDGGLAKLHLH